MSEYQYYAFRAIDRPLSDKDLKYARDQSSRAEITRWSFENKYHFGDFRGNPVKLLQTGFDVHLHYANFGIRTVMMKLPSGLPVAKSMNLQYVDGNRLCWKKDRKGNGGILTASPYLESGSVDQLWDLGDYVDDLVEIRNRLVAGDLRALYALWLCANHDDYEDPTEMTEPPVPAGLSEAPGSNQRILEFFGIDPMLLVAASEIAPPLTDANDEHAPLRKWIDMKPEHELRKLLTRFLTEDVKMVRADAIRQIRDDIDQPAWPTVPGRRTYQQLCERALELRNEWDAKERARQAANVKREAKRQEKKRRERMEQMVKDPPKFLKESETLVAARGTANYKAAAELLADLRKALGGTEGDKVVLPHAARLHKRHPTLTRLTGSLRQCGLLRKK